MLHGQEGLGKAGGIVGEYHFFVGERGERDNQRNGETEKRIISR